MNGGFLLYQPLLEAPRENIPINGLNKARYEAMLAYKLFHANLMPIFHKS